MNIEISITFALAKTVDVAQQVRASDCGSEGRGFEPHLPPSKKALSLNAKGFFFFCAWLGCSI